ncbi:choline-sulfatase [Conexibacter sp. JD483]|uniref:choline-sulfatase n=1 Tax=unclassified Conexibacter TaxID=2627773 RepID=UPI00272800E5|nr:MULTISPECIES: choline-sulfatase [unclassified Conexibacter]MDO8186548.1 choline-sulfatase [Conexibacter sp. CPCC 205706]MDO8200117.1 choline-sulfatase [Conexibacter sp. CPCC 205762]MDR9371999.1 choline-sulfatase [Conexibacter sp. JD483]
MTTDRPNILLIQADQLTASALTAYGNATVDAPHLAQLAEEGVVFDRAYCNSPLCAPSRASMLAGELPSAIGAYDNAAEFPASVPTFAHRLRAAGYRTSLVGKMHFIGPDQLHGFEERPTTDVYPADLEMVPDWRLSDDQRLAWYHDTRSIGGAEVSAATLQRDYDDAVTFHACRALTDFARDRTFGSDERPFLLVAGYIAPHDPYEPPQQHWDRYEGVAIDAPAVPAPLPAGEGDDAHSRRLRAMCELDVAPPSAEEVERARRGYYACVSYLDDQVGAILRRLDELGLRESTVVVFTSDHGDMLGERGLWYKMAPFEDSARVPLIVSAPGRYEGGRRIGRTVSLVDLLPTFSELAGSPDGPPTAGASFAGLLARDAGSEASWPDSAVIEYLAEGVRAPQLTLVSGQHKLIVCPGDPDLLYDLHADPRELHDLAADPAHAGLLARLREQLLAGYDLDALRARVLRSQQGRRLVHQALVSGRRTTWDHAPADASSEQYVRGDFWTAIERGRLAPQR